jgi:uncharacterized protein (TIGR02453 family)
MASTFILPTTFNFLKKLSVNNDRDWFAENRDKYESAKSNVEEFVDALIAKMTVHDSIETPSAKRSLYRIYNDVRFSKDKAPYNARFAGYLKRTKPMFRGGYYYWIKPGGSKIGCGFGFPNADDLRRIRQDIDLNYDDWRKLLRSRNIVKTFGAMQGDQLRTSPRGFQNDHPAIDLLRYKQFWFERSYSDTEVLAKDFLKRMNDDFKMIRPFFDYMSDVLTMDANGEAIRR